MGVSLDRKNYSDPGSRGFLDKFKVDAGGIGDAFARGFNGITAGIINLFGGALLGRWDRVDPDDIIINDGQIQLKNRQDLLAGVNGYCAAYQTKNINTGKTEKDNLLGWINVWKPEERLLPFNGELGPSKGAHIGQGGIVFDEEGLWTVYVFARRAKYGSTVRDATPSSKCTVYVANEAGENYTEREYKIFSVKVDYDSDSRVDIWPDDDVSVSICIPIVIPAPGYKVSVGVRDSSPTWWRGGTKYATLAVLKHDNRTSNIGRETVPDEEI